MVSSGTRTPAESQARSQTGGVARGLAELVEAGALQLPEPGAVACA